MVPELIWAKLQEVMVTSENMLLQLGKWPVFV